MLSSPRVLASTKLRHAPWVPASLSETQTSKVSKDAAERAMHAYMQATSTLASTRASSPFRTLQQTTPASTECGRRKTVSWTLPSHSPSVSPTRSAELAIRLAAAQPLSLNGTENWAPTGKSLAVSAPGTLADRTEAQKRVLRSLISERERLSERLSAHQEQARMENHQLNSKLSALNERYLDEKHKLVSQQEQIDEERLKMRSEMLKLQEKFDFDKQQLQDQFSTEKLNLSASLSKKTDEWRKAKIQMDQHLRATRARRIRSWRARWLKNAFGRMKMAVELARRMNARRSRLERRINRWTTRSFLVAWHKEVILQLKVSFWTRGRNRRQLRLCFSLWQGLMHRTVALKGVGSARLRAALRATLARAVRAWAKQLAHERATGCLRAWKKQFFLRSWAWSAMESRKLRQANERFVALLRGRRNREAKRRVVGAWRSMSLRTRTLSHGERLCAAKHTKVLLCPTLRKWTLAVRTSALRRVHQLRLVRGWARVVKCERMAKRRAVFRVWHFWRRLICRRSLVARKHKLGATRLLRACTSAWAALTQAALARTRLVLVWSRGAETRRLRPRLQAWATSALRHQHQSRAAACVTRLRHRKSAAHAASWFTLHRAVSSQRTAAVERHRGRRWRGQCKSVIRRWEQVCGRWREFQRTAGALERRTVRAWVRAVVIAWRRAGLGRGCARRMTAKVSVKVKLRCFWFWAAAAWAVGLARCRTSQALRTVAVHPHRVRAAAVALSLWRALVLARKGMRVGEAVGRRVAKTVRRTGARVLACWRAYVRVQVSQYKRVATYPPKLAMNRLRHATWVWSAHTRLMRRLATVRAAVVRKHECQLLCWTYLTWYRRSRACYVINSLAWRRASVRGVAALHLWRWRAKRQRRARAHVGRAARHRLRDTLVAWAAQAAAGHVQVCFRSPAHFRAHRRALR